MTTLRSEEAFPSGRFGAAHYRAVHKHLFQDVYRWAGRYRTVRTSKAGNAFCFPEYIDSNMEKLFARLGAPPFTGGASLDKFAADAASFLAELNAIHPFREGNGRSQLSFLFLIGTRAGHPLDLTRVKREPMMAAMINSYHGELAPLVSEIYDLGA